MRVLDDFRNVLQYKYIMPKVSILVPIYNASEYLHQAIDSLVNQTLRDIEIICINDGSSDDSLKIIQEYARKDSRIVILNKSNTGYGDSMNQGLKLARGEYIGILEPDDYLELNAFEKLYQLASWHHADIVKANYFLLENNQDRPNRVIHPKDTGKIIYPRQNHFIFHLPPAIWSAIYRREFLLNNQLGFLPTPGASYQDLGFNIKTLALAQRVVLTTDAFLHYRVDNVNSSSKSSSKLNCVVEEYASIEDFLRTHQLLSDLGPAIVGTKFGNYLWNILRLPAPAAQKFYQTTLSELRSAKSFGLLRRSAFRPKYWILAQMMLKAPKLTKEFLIRSRGS